MAQTQRYYVQKSPVAGRGLFASEDIPAGEQIFAIPRPFVAVLDYPRLADCCSNCFAVPASLEGYDAFGAGAHEVKACGQCKLLRFCSKECQTEAWKRFHKFECKTFSKYGASKPWAHAIRAAIQIMNMQSNGLLSDEEWAAFQRMSSHLDDIKRQGGEQFANFEIVSQGILNLASPKGGFTLNDAQHIYGRIESNSLTLVTSTFDALGLVVDPLLATANHSCDPNVYVLMDGPKMSLRTLRSIPKDEEIFISYIDTSFPVAIRQRNIEERFHFICQCHKCIKAATRPHESLDDQYLGHPTELAPEWKAFIKDGYRKNIVPPIAQEFWKGLPKDLAAQSQQPFWDAEYLEEFAYKVSVIVFKDDFGAELDELIETQEFLLRLLATSKRFALWRQPYGSIRQEHYLTNLSHARKFQQAWRQAAKIYFNVDPVLYPQTQHPLRVVHNASLALLTLTVATDPDFLAEQGSSKDPIHDIDLGVLLYFLFVEILANIEKSHGKDNSFVKLVKAKFEQIKTDMTRSDPHALRDIGAKREETWRKFRSIADIPDRPYTPKSAAKSKS